MKTIKIIISDKENWVNTLELQSHSIGVFVENKKHSFIVSKLDETGEKRIVTKGTLLSPIEIFDSHLQFNAVLDTNRYSINFPIKKGMIEVNLKIFI